MRARGVRPEAGNAGLRQCVCEPRHERRLRSDHDQLHALADRHLDQAGDVIDADRQYASDVRDPGVAGRTEQLGPLR